MICVLLIALLSSCASLPKGANPVTRFDVDRYLGTWYEIARLDSRFERNLSNTLAQYRLDEPGRIQVQNSGYNEKKKEWVNADGVAKFRGETDRAALKVSFFGPFFSGYNVIALAGDYQYALVAGKNLKYLWILSRSKSLPDSVRDDFLQRAREIGYDTEQLIWVAHDKTSPFEDED